MKHFHYLALGCWWAFTQVLPAQQENLPPDSSPAGKEASGTLQANARNARELLKKLNEENAKNEKRILEIEGILFPYEDRLAQELFFLSPGEFTFLRKQTEAAQVANQFFQAQSRLDRSTWDGVSLFFDLAYDALQAGYLWVGRENELVAQDAQLFNDLQTKVQEEMARRPEGAEMLKLARERQELLTKMKSSGPLLKYLTERRQWWKSYPDYEATVLEAQPR